MAFSPKTSSYHWQDAISLLPASDPSQTGPQGALVPDSQHEFDHIAVVYDKGKAPPRITVEQVSGMVHKVLADGVAVAVVARAEGQVPDPSEVLLVERHG